MESLFLEDPSNTSTSGIEKPMKTTEHKGAKLRLYYLLSFKDNRLSVDIKRTRETAWGRIKRSISFELAAFRKAKVVASVAPEDMKILMRLYMGQAANARLYVLSGKDGYQLFVDMVKTGRCYWGEGAGTPIKKVLARQGRLGWQAMLDGSQKPSLELTPPASHVFPLSPPVYLEVRSMQAGAVTCSLPNALIEEWLSQRPLRAEAFVAFGKRMQQRYPGESVPVPQSLEICRHEGIEPTPVLTILEKALEPSSSTDGIEPVTVPIIELHFDYEVKSVHWAESAMRLSFVEHNQLHQLTRDQSFEDKTLSRLLDIGLCMLSEAYPHHFLKNHEKDLTVSIKNAFEWGTILQTELPRLEAQGWRVVQEQSIELIAPEADDWYSELTPVAAEWFEFEAGFVLNGKRYNLLPVVQDLIGEYLDVDLAEMEHVLSECQVSIPLGNGQLALVEGSKLYPLIRNLYELYSDHGFTANKRVKLNAWRVAELLELENSDGERWQIPEYARKLHSILTSGMKLEPMLPPSGLQAELRPYQQTGLAWLQCMRDHELDGILADDMGLGKTLQTIAHILAEKNAGRLNTAVLVIVPTSLIYNWEHEVSRFAPELSLMTFYGAERRELFSKLGSTDIVLTTYRLLVRDLDYYKEQHFSYIILDEAQNIKNPRSQAAKSICSLKSARRLCISGTPMENHLGELWSLFNFLMPGFLGEERFFNKNFRVPIEKGGSNKLRSILNRKTAPFIMRRKKDEVVKELPPKTEIVRNMELTHEQQELYDTVRLAVSSEVKSVIAKKGIGRAQITILDALLKLRQICCDPRLHKRRAGYKSESSCKLHALMNMLPDFVEEGRKAIIFSQFTSMLDLIEKDLKKAKLNYTTLTGKTQNRRACVERFQSGEVPLMLISLKAGGTGLNLTAADTVIHYDPWWNPSVELQATDRAHRIGQDKPVFVYKFITQNTVETKILAMQQHKRELVEGILSNSVNTSKIKFSEEDLELLFG